ncbi:methyltransferase domain-containing protein [Pseudomonas sp. L-22-4S-12]|uniref:class I SAM-dependent methyltransferase n=1 Tax=Pseudomonas sp. L-22-4S-12 TaxID=2610893 RepID=UPI0015B45D42|nr:methyltransferase domain-containing protein [Pseudomonas sp. L-22-4S-12]
MQDWIRMPSLEAWLERAKDENFVDARNCGLVDAVQSGWYQSDSNELFVDFPISAQDIVVDVGCGGGGATLFCANRGAHVVFTDVMAEKIDALVARVASTPARACQGIVSDSCPLPLENNFATRVMAMEMLEHVEDPAEVLRELVRIGQPGALYLLSVPDAAAERLQQGFAPPEYYLRPNHIHIFEREEFSQLVQDAGLEIVNTATYGFFWTLWMCMYWVCKEAVADSPEKFSHDAAQPPYFPLLDDWASVWYRLISLPQAAPMRKALDEALPKSQIIIARKPG